MSKLHSHAEGVRVYDLTFGYDEVFDFCDKEFAVGAVLGGNFFADEILEKRFAAYLLFFCHVAPAAEGASFCDRLVKVYNALGFKAMDRDRKAGIF